MSKPEAGRVAAAAQSGPAGKHAAVRTAALDVFVRQGYAATSLDDVATTAGVSRQTVYNQFGDKQRLFLTVLDEALAAMLDELRGATELPPPVNASDADSAERYLLEVARRVLNRFLQPDAGRLRLLVQSEAPRYPAVLELWRTRAKTPVWSVLIGNLSRLAHAGALELPDPTRAAGQLVTLITGTVWEMTEFGTFTTADTTTLDLADLDAALRANVQLFVRGHTPTPSR